MKDPKLSRRTFLKGLAGSVTAAMFQPSRLFASDTKNFLTKPIPSTGEQIPVIGMGTWQTFNVGNDKKLRRKRTKVLKAFFEAGGNMVDSSPMYGSSQDVVGYGLERLEATDRVFSADKIWTSDGSETKSQLKKSSIHWSVDSFDLMQVHNLLSWEEHLPKLQKLKDSGNLRYVGITTSHGRRHAELEKVIKNHDIDFVQLTYNLLDREVEDTLLPLARKRGIAVIANRPFRGGSLVDRLQNNNYPLPEWASKFDCSNWPQFLLKFIVSHPAVTCAIPATTQVEHVKENMGAARGTMPDEKVRSRMLAYVTSL